MIPPSVGALSIDSMAARNDPVWKSMFDNLPFTITYIELAINDSRILSQLSTLKALLYRFFQSFRIASAKAIPY